MEHPIPIELHNVQNTLNFLTNGKTLEIVTFLPSEETAILPFLDPTVENYSILEITILHIDLQQDHVLDLRRHLEVLSKINNQVYLKIKTTALKTFQSQKTKLNLECIPVKWQML